MRVMTSELKTRRLNAKNTEEVLQIPLPILFQWILANYQHGGEWLVPTLVGQSNPSAEPDGYYSDAALFNSGELEQAFASFVNDKTKTQSGPLAPSSRAAAQSQSAKANNFNNEVNNDPLTQTARGEVAYQFPLPTLLPYSKVAPPAPKQTDRSPAAVASRSATGYNYFNSPYFQEAERLIAKCDSASIAPELIFGCKLVLAVVLAWCNFSLFAQTGGRKGQWIMLSQARLAKEARLRLEAVNQHLAELQGLGLLRVGSAATGLISPEEFSQLRYDVSSRSASQNGFCHARSIQRKNNVYKLLIQPGLPLQGFEPFENLPKPTASQSGDKSAKAEELDLNRAGKDLITAFPAATTLTAGSERPQSQVGKTLLIPQLDLERPDEALKVVSSNNKVFPTSITETTCINSLNINNDNDVKHAAIALEFEDLDAVTVKPVAASLSGTTPRSGKINPDGPGNRLQKFISRLMGEKRAKFEFLTRQASFAGYAREQDGRTTMDDGPAYNFALRSDLSLPRMQELYSQVREVWEQGGIRPGSNPIAYLYWAIRQDKDPRPGGSLEAQLNLQQAQTDRQVSYSREYSSAQVKGAFNNERPRTDDPDRGTAAMGSDGATSPEPATRQGEPGRPAYQTRPGRPYQSYGSKAYQPHFKPGNKGTDHNAGWD